MHNLKIRQIHFTVTILGKLELAGDELVRPN